jgi:hypothetical protein
MLAREFGRRYFSKRPVRAALIVFVLPGCDLHSASLSDSNQWAFRHSSRKVPLNDSTNALRRLAWPAELDFDLVVVSPEIEGLTCELAAVVTKQCARHSATLSKSVQHGHNVCPSQPLSDFDWQTLARKDIDDGQAAKAVSI